MINLLIFLVLSLLPFVIVTGLFSFQWEVLLPTIMVVVIFVIGFWLIKNRKSQRGLIIYLFFLYLAYFATLFLFLFESALIDFSGRGFTDEMFFHLEWESVRIGLNDYIWVLLGFVMTLIAYVFTLKSAYKRLPVIGIKYRWLLIVAGLGLLAWVVPYLGFTRLYYAAHDYMRIDTSKLDNQRIKQFVELGVLQNGRITSKSNLKAEVTADSKNLILIYLESFNDELTHHPKYPNLTPNLNKLSEEFQSFNHLSSSYVTIEGIISSQCGTLVPMTADNNTFLKNGHLLTRMPCLGDVLNRAGYRQYYLGGSVMEFAGKGQFFENHGYDDVRGWEYWQAQGIKKRAGIWGLSDTELFKQALNVVVKADKAKPYNLTLLTLGTHLPGYIYEECTPYNETANTFVNAIHCSDQLVGRFIDKLQVQGLLDNTLVVIVADHGVFPTPEMKSLFGDMVEDRTLVGLTNFSKPLPNEFFSSYDLAPTILDMLNVQHNAEFLYGQSLFSNMKGNQKYATRYQDWGSFNEHLVYNVAGECTEPIKPLTWPLNSCDKQNLLVQTNHLLDFYSDKASAELLGCELDIEFKSDSKKPGKTEALIINDINHFEHFYYKGYLLNYFNLDTGFFVFELDQDMNITEHRYYKDNEDEIRELMKWKEGNNNHLLIMLKTNDNNLLQGLAIKPDDQKMDVQAFQFIENTLVSHHAFNLNDTTSLRTCFDND